MSILKQKKVINKMIENGGCVSSAMRDAEYSKAYARNPHKLLATKTFQALLDKYLPDNLLAKKHRELLDAKKVISANIFPDGKDGKPVNDFIEVEDNITQGKMVELGYKVKRKLIEQIEQTTVPEDLDNLSEEELRAKIRDIDKKLKGTARGKDKIADAVDDKKGK